MKYLFMTAFLLSTTLVDAQSVFSQFTYGTIAGREDTLTGYFRFESGISSMGQKIYFRGEDKKGVSKSLWAKDYYFFESDSDYLATWPVSTITGDIYVMLPRVINGTLQVFEYAFNGGPMNLIKTQHYYYIKNETSSSKVTKKNFKKIMRYIIPDNQDLLTKIDKGELKFSHLKNIIVQYNETALQNNKR